MTVLTSAAPCPPARRNRRLEIALDSCWRSKPSVEVYVRQAGNAASREKEDSTQSMTVLTCRRPLAPARAP